MERQPKKKITDINVLAKSIIEEATKEISNNSIKKSHRKVKKKGTKKDRKEPQK